METTSVLFAGVGGQGIILASKILARCAFNEGLMVKESELHGMAQRGGSVVSHVRYGPEVYSPLIPLGRADFLVAMEELEGLRYEPYLKPGAAVVLNQRQVMPALVNAETGQYPADAGAQLRSRNFRVVELNALEMAKGLGNLKVENIILLGALSRYLAFRVELWERTIAEAVPTKTVELNLKAFQAGREAGDSRA
ncbi:MAG TPA: indolepyruvate oxidoreductase subunit beta [Desulfatiglandales bacterium]|nr:indolepyruvate oxidoreductase subunit beta [Desulfatiglandales bacterium]